MNLVGRKGVGVANSLLTSMARSRLRELAVPSKGDVDMRLGRIGYLRRDLLTWRPRLGRIALGVLTWTSTSTSVGRDHVPPLVPEGLL